MAMNDSLMIYYSWPIRGHSHFILAAGRFYGLELHAEGELDVAVLAFIKFT